MALGLDLDYIDRAAEGEFDLGGCVTRDCGGVRAKPGPRPV